MHLVGETRILTMRAHPQDGLIPEGVPPYVTRPPNRDRQAGFAQEVSRKTRALVPSCREILTHRQIAAGRLSGGTPRRARTPPNRIQAHYGSVGPAPPQTDA